MSFEEAQAHVLEAERIIASMKNAHEADRQGFTGWSRENLIALARVHVALAEVTKDTLRPMGGFQRRREELP